jgi:hypothetical protein
MPRHRLRLRKRFASFVLTLSVLAAGWAGGANAEPQAFHLVEINKLLVGYNGNTSIQAIELKLITSGENFVGGAFLAVYDSLAAPVATLGTFPGNVANGLAGDRILCATAAFASAFSITPDLVIQPGIPMVTGQVSFEKVGCPVNSLPYENILARVNGTSNATPLPAHGATALVRVTDNPTFPSCPQGENAAQRFQLRAAGNANPHVFQNNARDTVQVWTTVTGVEPEPVSPAVRRWSASPNPFTASTTIRISDRASRVALYDVRGRLVRSWEPSAFESGGPSSAVHWDGRDAGTRPMPTGLYFMEAITDRGSVRGRVLLLRRGQGEHHSH